MPKRKPQPEPGKPESQRAAESATGPAPEAAQTAIDSEAEAESGEVEATPENRVAELEAKAAELKDQLLRTLAETENVRRRAQRDREDALKYAAAPLLRDLLAVADNLSRAIESVPEDDGGRDERLEILLDGVKLTQKELNAVFDKHHVVKLEPIGERLDPHRHEAMFEVPGSDQPSGTVVQVIQAGYLLHDRLLRPARVGVSKGGPAQAAETATQAEKNAGGEQDPPNAAPGSRLDTTI